jgi:hypothetical protein
MVGSMFAVLGVGIGMGLVMRFIVPGRHGLVKVVIRDTKLLPRILAGSVPGRIGILKILGRDVDLRWTLLLSLAGAYGGFFAGRNNYSMYSMRWIFAIGAAVVLDVLYMIVARLAHSAKTRRLGIHGQRASLA